LNAKEPVFSPPLSVDTDHHPAPVAPVLTSVRGTGHSRERVTFMHLFSELRTLNSVLRLYPLKQRDGKMGKDAGQAHDGAPVVIGGREDLSGIDVLETGISQAVGQNESGAAPHV
jgi:hypothetical protein